MLIHQLRVEARELVARGLRRRYTRVDESLSVPRGRIDVHRIARQGGVIEAATPSIHYPRLEDTLVNRVLLSGLHLASRLTDDLVLRTSIRRLAALKEEHVRPVRLDGEVMRRDNREMNRLTGAYEPAMTLITLLMQASGIALDEDESGVQLLGFLFDMNIFFEALMSRFLGDNLPGHTVRDQYRLRGLMSYAPGYNPQHKQAPTPKPDFAVFQNGAMVAMLDTKYRDLWATDLPRDMLYQLAIYALSQGTGGLATILYSTLDPAAKEQVVDIREAVYGERRAQVVLRPVDLGLLRGIISSIGAQAERIRGAYARNLISNRMRVAVSGR